MLTREKIDRQSSVITELMKKLQDLVGESIEINTDPNRKDIFIDLSNLNFEKLRKLFDKEPEQIAQIISIRGIGYKLSLKQ